ncbi:serine hydrolase [Fundicoccus culcitae]|uniref:Class A beta-lactamase-related serine hydrolase n=1 Tax=Fundicoccus culcitae TaxID=2969821 RepID=A0ABY5P3K6_9LACT|nr:serine hydrolase [Fundicoccus culcitae]UUX33080.1 class A beta-lactamase-related serine hydrolase [Fundicoccus culcitae]
MHFIKLTLVTTLCLSMMSQWLPVTASASNWPDITESIITNDEADKKITLAADTALERYDYDAMANLGVENHDLSEHNSLREAIYALMAEYQIDESQVAIAYTNLQTGENIYINEDEQMIVASMYKVPMIAMYIDLINQGVLSWDSQLPYSEDYFQDGAGDITAEAKRDYYSLDELAYQAIVYSDNTASLILYFYYVNNFGSFRTALLDFVDYYDVPDLYYQDNYGSAYIMNEALVKIASNPIYEPLTDLMMQTYPKQLFSLFVNNMATKYGQLDEMLNDSGIYYEDGEPVYTLVLMTRDANYPEIFIGELNLLVNEWSHEYKVANN